MGCLQSAPLASIITAIKKYKGKKKRKEKKKRGACCFVVLFILFEFLDPMRIRENKSIERSLEIKPHL